MFELDSIGFIGSRCLILLIGTILPTYFLFYWGYIGEKTKESRKHIIKVSIIWFLFIIILSICSWLQLNYIHHRSMHYGFIFDEEEYLIEQEKERKQYPFFRITDEELRIYGDNIEVLYNEVAETEENVQTVFMFLLLGYNILGIVTISIRIIYEVKKHKPKEV